MSVPEPESCERFHVAVSALLDGELSPLESAQLRHHAAGCAPCRTYAADLERIATHLRDSALRLPAHHVAVPARPTTHAFQRVFYGAAAIAMVVVTVGLGAGQGSSDAPSSAAHESAYLQSMDYERRLLSSLSRSRLLPVGASAHAPS